jgi:phosphoglycolate phosphatase
MYYKAAIFDLDGTLIDTMEDISRSLNTGLIEFGFEPLSINECRKRVGWGLFKLVESALPSVNRPDGELIYRITEALKHEYRKDPVRDTRPYPGISKALHILQDMKIPMFVWTNKEQLLGETILGILFPEIRFSGIFGDTPERPKKPDPATSDIIIEMSGAERDEVIYFGDSDVDMETAKSSRFRAIGVLWGYRSAEELLRAGAEKLIGSPEEMVLLATNREAPHASV